MNERETKRAPLRLNWHFQMTKQALRILRLDSVDIIEEKQEESSMHEQLLLPSLYTDEA